jgi:hypothetical protein
MEEQASPTVKDINVKGATESKIRIVQLTDLYTDDGLMRYIVFARFHTDGRVQIVQTTYTFDDDDVTVKTRSVDLGHDEFDVLIASWQSWEPFHQ